MEKIIPVIIIVLSAVKCLYASNELCCDQDQGLVCPEAEEELTCPEYPKEKPLCWHPLTKDITPIDLACSIGDSIGFAFDTEWQIIYVNSNGQLVLQLEHFNVTYEPGSFCMGNVTNTSDVNLTHTHRAAVVCYTDDEEVKYVPDTVYGYCMLVSAIFLFITALIYIVLPELRDLLGKSIINLCLSLGLGLTFIGVEKNIDYLNMTLCAIRGFLGYFFVIAGFFWTNAISIQILLGLKRPSVLNYGWKEFTWYAIYAWGTSVALTVVVATINFMPGRHPKPGIGLDHCGFFNVKMQWWYMYSVMTTLIIINICIFIYTSVILWRHSFSSNHIKSLKFKFMMTVRLFFVMGVPWVFEMIGSSGKSHIVWEIFALMNTIQGVLIFLVLVIFRRRVIKLMYQRGWLDCVAGPLERCLAVGEDEENVVQHTIGVSMDEPKINGNGTTAT